jgi:hypothetical protein
MNSPTYWLFADRNHRHIQDITVGGIVWNACGQACHFVVIPVIRRRGVETRRTKWKLT